MQVDYISICKVVKDVWGHNNTDILQRMPWAAQDSVFKKHMIPTAAMTLHEVVAAVVLLFSAFAAPKFDFIEQCRDSA